MTTSAIILIVALVLYAFLLGSIFGQWYERRWQFKMKRDRDELEFIQGEVDSLIAKIRRPTLEWYDRVN